MTKMRGNISPPVPGAAPAFSKRQKARPEGSAPTICNPCGADFKSKQNHAHGDAVGFPLEAPKKRAPSQREPNGRGYAANRLRRLSTIAPHAQSPSTKKGPRTMCEGLHLKRESVGAIKRSQPMLSTSPCPWSGLSSQNNIPAKPLKCLRACI